MKDEKDNLLGQPYDYEYRGWKRERYRDFPLWKSTIIWGTIGLLFAVMGIWMLFDSLSNIFPALFCLAITGLMGWIIYKGHLKHKVLLKAIEKF